MQSDTYHWISTFLEAQAAELGAATNTQLAYGRDLKDFDSFLAGRNSDFARAGRDDVDEIGVDQQREHGPRAGK